MNLNYQNEKIKAILEENDRDQDRVCTCYDMLHNSDYDLCGTENRCANRLRLC